ncbi:MAG: hypothetical protein LAQ69_05805 [Acidobacteriia bacterium]|nr:hypothetical protein [Terriglobia bacterium]
MARSLDIFYGWSQERSHRVSEALDAFVGGVVKDLGIDYHSFLSSQSIPTGKRWFDWLMEELGKANAAMLCLTPEAIGSSWIHYEAGAMGARFGYERVMVYLHGVSEPLTGPLGEFQNATSTRESTRKMIGDLLVSLEFAVPEEAFGRVFEAHWPGLEVQLRASRYRHAREIVPGFESRFERKTFREAVYDCIEEGWLRRYRGVIETLAGLQSYLPTVEGQCHPDETRAFTDLVSELDGYAMVHDGTLLMEKKMRPEGTPLRDRSEIQPAEERRIRVCRLASELAEPPILEESYAYDRLPTHAERKLRVIHPAERDMPALRARIAERLADCLTSARAFDRIAAHLVQEHDDVPVADLIRASEDELERIRGVTEPSSLAPLYYAVRAIGRRNIDRPGLAAEAQRIEQFASDVRAYIARYAEGKVDADSHLRGYLDRLLAKVRSGT